MELNDIIQAITSIGILPVIIYLLMSKYDKTIKDLERVMQEHNIIVQKLIDRLDNLNDKK